MKSKLRTLLRGGVVATVLITTTATPSAAQWAVYDAANHTENILQTARALEQIRQQIEQLETMYTNLERISNPSWRDLRAYMLYLNEVAAQGEALAYSAEGVFERFRETMVGFVPMEPGLDYGEVYSAWMATALDTLAATLDSVSAQSQDYLSTQDQIAELQALANGSRGNLEALNVSNMLQSHVGQEIAKLNQLLSASINAQNVYWGLTLTLEANHEATERWLIEESLEDFHVYDGQGGFTGVPGGWPYACGGCSD